jgi:SAM-dependent methyltransferase
VHDNACGAGAMTSAIMSTSPPKIHIDATDVNKQFAEGTGALAKEKGWLVTAATMSAQELTFPDAHFTHSFTAFAFHCIGDHETAAKQIYRTVKPGGTAVASVWVYMPHVAAMQHAHWRTRGRDGPMPTLLPLEDYQEKDLRAALVAGGFEDGKTITYEQDFYVAIPDLARWSQLAWSYLGTLPTGWSQNDEDKWEEAVSDIEEQMKAGDGISKNDKGETVLRMVACIAVATK